MTQDFEEEASPRITGPRLSKEEVLEKPWKYKGYKGYAEFVSSDDDVFILRRFGTLNARIGLALQDEMVVLEAQLAELDENNSRREAADVNNGTLRNDLPDRKELVTLIGKKLRRYNNFVLQQSNLSRYPAAPRRDVQTLSNWHYMYDDRVIDLEERKYLEQLEDLICVAQKDKTPLRRLIDKSQGLRTLPIWRNKGKQAPENDYSEASYYSDKRLDGFASAVIVTVGVTMLLVPIWVLFAMKTLKEKLGVITAFVSLFLLILSFAMVAKPFEALGATAAYAAVLMVFVQIGEEG